MDKWTWEVVGTSVVLHRNGEPTDAEIIPKADSWIIIDDDGREITQSFGTISEAIEFFNHEHHIESEYDESSVITSIIGRYRSEIDESLSDMRKCCVIAERDLNALVIAYAGDEVFDEGSRHLDDQLYSILNQLKNIESRFDDLIRRSETRRRYKK